MRNHEITARHCIHFMMDPFYNVSCTDKTNPSLYLTSSSHGTELALAYMHTCIYAYMESVQFLQLYVSNNLYAVPEIAYQEECNSTLHTDFKSQFSAFVNRAVSVSHICSNSSLYSMGEERSLQITSVNRYKKLTSAICFTMLLVGHSTICVIPKCNRTV